MNVEDLTRLLQLSISPIVLISGVGLLLLSITNRLARAIDRSRGVARELETGGAGAHHQGRDQLRILMRRAELLRRSVIFIAASVFLSTLMIILIFLTVFFRLPLEMTTLTVFAVDVLCIAISVIYFLLDVLLSLRALHLEVAEHLTPPPR